MPWPKQLQVLLASQLTTLMRRDRSIYSINFGSNIPSQGIDGIGSKGLWERNAYIPSSVWKESCTVLFDTYQASMVMKLLTLANISFVFRNEIRPL